MYDLCLLFSKEVRMKEYSEMSDGELSWKIWHTINKIPKGHATICIFNINNPSDIMPIAIEREINIEFQGGGFVNAWVDNDGGNFESQIHSKGEAYRAIAICFLKMMDSKKALTITMKDKDGSEQVIEFDKDNMANADIDPFEEIK